MVADTDMTDSTRKRDDQINEALNFKSEKKE